MGVVTRIFSHLGLFTNLGQDNKSAIQVAKLIESLTRLVNAVAVKHKFRLMLQILYSFENKPELTEDDFMGEIERLSAQLNPIEGQDLSQNLSFLSDKIGFFTSEWPIAFVRASFRVF